MADRRRPGWGDVLYWRTTLQWIIFWPRYVRAEDFPDGEAPSRWTTMAESWRYTRQAMRRGDPVQTLPAWLRMRRRRRAAQREFDRRVS